MLRSLAKDRKSTVAIIAVRFEISARFGQGDFGEIALLGAPPFDYTLPSKVERHAMNKLDQALSDLQSIREQLERTHKVACYRSTTTFGSAVLALLGNAAQVVWFSNCSARAFVAFWTTIALIAVGIIAAEMAYRFVRFSTLRERSKTREAVLEFVPCILVACGFTLVLVEVSPESVRLLPGAWACFFALGVYASRHHVSRLTGWIAGYYFASGLFCMGATRYWPSASIWSMAVTFGVGQILTSLVLHYEAGKRND
jgi:hypothetical protein